MSLTKKTTSGVKWSSLSTFIKMIIQIVQLSVLTYLLDKSDFGIIAIATMIIGFTEIFSNLGLAVGIIHKQNITNKEYSTLYWLNIIASVVMFLILWGATPLLVKFYNEPVLMSIVPLLGLQIIINAFGKIFQTIKTKELDFQFISKVSITAVMLGFIATVALAFYGFGVYSLVIGQLIQVLFNQMVYVYYGRKENRVQFYFNFAEVRSFVKIGGYQLGSQILDFASYRIDVILIGRFFGMEVLGIYNIAKELIAKPFQLINSLVTNVASASFSIIQDDLSKVKQNFAKVLNFISTASIPLYIMIFVFSDFVVSILYSSEFSQVALFLRLMILVGIASSISSVSSILIIAKGRTDIGFRWTIVRVVVSTIVILITSQIGINTVAVAQSVLAVVFLFVFWYIATRKLSGLTLKEYSNTFIESLLVAVLLGGIFEVTNRIFDFSIIGQLVLIGLYMFFYAGYYFLFRKAIIREIIQLVKR